MNTSEPKDIQSYFTITNISNFPFCIVEHIFSNDTSNVSNKPTSFFESITLQFYYFVSNFFQSLLPKSTTRYDIFSFMFQCIIVIVLITIFLIWLSCFILKRVLHCLSSTNCKEINADLPAEVKEHHNDCTEIVTYQDENFMEQQGYNGLVKTNQDGSKHQEKINKIREETEQSLAKMQKEVQDYGHHCDIQLYKHSKKLNIPNKYFQTGCIEEVIRE